MLKFHYKLSYFELDMTFLLKDPKMCGLIKHLCRTTFLYRLESLITCCIICLRIIELTFSLIEHLFIQTYTSFVFLNVLCLLIEFLSLINEFQDLFMTVQLIVTDDYPFTQQKTHNLFWPDENSIEQCFAAHIVQGCHQHCSTLLHLIAG